MISKQYLAGLIDGEGYVSISLYEKRRLRPIIQIELGSKPVNKELLLQIKEQYGGSFSDRSKQSCQISRNVRLTFNDRFAEKLLKELFPYIIIKKDNFLLIRKLLKIKYSIKKSKSKIVDEKTIQEINELLIQIRDLNTSLKRPSKKYYS